MNEITTQTIKEVPVLFLIFNRPDTTKNVFAKIKKAKPSKLYIASDGPRKNKEDEEKNVLQIREYVLNQINWNCELNILFRDENLGCKAAVTSAIDWFFENEEFGIILEDDCVPDESFFPFCQELLLRYKDDTRISGITGTNFNSHLHHGVTSYFYSEILYMWGWATWRRAWNFNKYFSTNFFEIIKDPHVQNICKYRHANKMWIKESANAINGHIDTWDYPWLFSNIVDRRLAIVPCCNLITNIGINPMATHTKHKREEYDIKSQEIKLPLIHTNYILPNTTYDLYFYKYIYGWNSILSRIRIKIIKVIKIILKDKQHSTYTV